MVQGDQGDIASGDIDRNFPCARRQRKQGGGKEQMLSHHYILHRLIPVFITDVLVASGDRTLTDGIFEVEWNDS